MEWKIKGEINMQKTLWFSQVISVFVIMATLGADSLLNLLAGQPERYLLDMIALGVWFMCCKILKAQHP